MRSLAITFVTTIAFSIQKTSAIGGYNVQLPALSETPHKFDQLGKIFHQEEEEEETTPVLTIKQNDEPLHVAAVPKEARNKEEEEEVVTSRLGSLTALHKSETVISAKKQELDLNATEEVIQPKEILLMGTAAKAVDKKDMDVVAETDSIGDYLVAVVPEDADKVQAVGTILQVAKHPNKEGGGGRRRGLRGKPELDVAFFSDVVSPVSFRGLLKKDPNLRQRLVEQGSVQVFKSSDKNHGRRLQSPECFQLPDGSVACVLEGFPQDSTLTIFFDCPTSPGSTLLDCRGCAIRNEDRLDQLDESDEQCNSCTICSQGISFDCTNIVSGACARVNCAGNCVNGGSGPPPTPRPAPAPGPSTCDAELSAAQTCAASSTVSACAQCVNAATETLAPQSTCAAAEAEICRALNSCDSICGTCEDEVEDLYDCVWRNNEDAAAAGCGGLVCPTRAPTPTPAPSSTCDAEQSAVQTCAASSTVSACVQCVNAATEAIVPQSTCAAAEAEICRALNSCDSVCGTCEDEVEAVWDCIWRNTEGAVAAGCGGLVCGSSPTPAPTPAPMPASPRDDDGPQCFPQNDGSVACVLDDFPREGLILVLLNCPTNPDSTLLDCQSCAIVEEDTVQAIDASDRQCGSCIVCSQTIAFNCANIDPEEACAVQTCNGLCTGGSPPTPFPTLAPQPAPTQSPTPRPTPSPTLTPTPEPTQLRFPDPTPAPGNGPGGAGGRRREICNKNGICDTADGETKSNCPEDCGECPGGAANCGGF